MLRHPFSVDIKRQTWIRHTHVAQRCVAGGVAVMSRELSGALFVFRQVRDHRFAELTIAGVVEGSEHGPGVYFEK